ncbi:hypothetical protein [Streptomyces sp. AK08-02]|nr:hypothetical protein [Streptomyces sp. AK08-02]MDX3746434.1 hypothetical protein [Streptomyces sp. AK08-02]
MPAAQVVAVPAGDETDFDLRREQRRVVAAVAGSADTVLAV